MGSDPTQEDDPSIQEVLDALDDPDCRTILQQTAEPRTAMELHNACDIPESTLYRKLNLLSTASLVRELIDIHPERGRITRYERDFDDVTISIDGEEFEVTIDRPARKADQRLADLWSKMGEEL